MPGNVREKSKSKGGGEGGHIALLSAYQAWEDARYCTRQIYKSKGGGKRGTLHCSAHTRPGKMQGNGQDKPKSEGEGEGGGGDSLHCSVHTRPGKMQGNVRDKSK